MEPLRYTGSRCFETKALIEFLLGLGTGLICLVIYKIRVLRKLKHRSPLAETPARSMPSFSITSQLFRMLEQHQQEERYLSTELDHWETLIDLAPIGYLRVDDQNQLIAGNPPALELLNIQAYSAQEPRLLMELVRSYDLDSLIEQARSSGKPCQSEWILYPPSVNMAHVAQPTPCPLRGYALPLQDGQVGVLLESRAEAQLLAQQRDRWTSDVAHELKTPLTSIRLVAEMLQPKLDPSLRTWVDRMLHETIRLSTLVQEILDLSHLEAARTRPLKLSSIDLPELIQSAWLSLEPIASAKQIILSYQGPDHLVMQADSARLHRVFLNLLDNSVKYSLPDRPLLIQIGLSQNNAQLLRTATANLIQIDLIDGGNGFAEEDLPMVFDRFYRADQSRSRQPDSLVNVSAAGSDDRSDRPARSLTASNVSVPSFQPSSGSGLGLAIVRQIVELHQGTITAKNHPEGGAWIQIQLPQRQN